MSALTISDLNAPIAEIQASLQAWSHELGFDGIGVAQQDLSQDEAHLLDWLAAGRHGEMRYMSRHGIKRSRPNALRPQTLSIISCRLNYWPNDAADPWSTLRSPEVAYVSRYALGRDYHKVMRRRLRQLGDKLRHVVGDTDYRVFVDTAPVLEKAIGRNAGLGWIGKHTNLIDRDQGSWFFLGEIYTDLPLRPTPAQSAHCGTCRACLDACPSSAIVAPYQVDARRCISYLTIEHEGTIPVQLRPLMGNRIYGCDDCQLVCPWNRHAPNGAIEFSPRHSLDVATLTVLFGWDKTTFEERLQGSAIRRIGHERWLRNLAVALGNAPTTPAIVTALRARRDHPSAIVREHVAWAIDRHMTNVDSR